jgi:hypothetical protein
MMEAQPASWHDALRERYQRLKDADGDLEAWHPILTAVVLGLRGGASRASRAQPVLHGMRKKGLCNGRARLGPRRRVAAETGADALGRSSTKDQAGEPRRDARLLARANACGAA